MGVTTGLPLADLIKDRLNHGSISKTDLVLGLGYSSLSKGHRRLSCWMQGRDLKNLIPHSERLSGLLSVSEQDMLDAIAQTQQILRDRADAAYAASFEPHAIFKTERTIPSQITFAAMTNMRQRLRLGFPTGLAVEGYPAYVLRHRPDMVPFFGKVVGFWINYQPDRAVEFDLMGVPQDCLIQAKLPVLKSKFGAMPL